MHGFSIIYCDIIFERRATPPKRESPALYEVDLTERGKRSPQLNPKERTERWSRVTAGDRPWGSPALQVTRNTWRVAEKSRQDYDGILGKSKDENSETQRRRAKTRTKSVVAEVWTSAGRGTSEDRAPARIGSGRPRLALHDDSARRPMVASENKLVI